MNIAPNRSALVFVLVLGVAAMVVSGKSKETVTARVFIGDCLQSENLSVPINRSQWRTVVSGIGGGGHLGGIGIASEKCSYSYNLLAVRIDRNRVKLKLTVTTPAWSVEKELILRRGKNVDLQLEHDVKLIAGF